MARFILRTSASFVLIFATLLSKGSQAILPEHNGRSVPVALQGDISRATKLFFAGEFAEAHPLYADIGQRALAAGAQRSAAMNWNNAGACSLHLMQYGAALKEFTRAKTIADAAQLPGAAAHALNNLASLYIETGQSEFAMQMALDGLRLPPSEVDPLLRAKIRYQYAFSLMRLDRFDEARPVYRQSVDELIDGEDINTAARELGAVGTELARGHRTTEAEWALSEALRLARAHRLQGVANILRGLAKVRLEEGDTRSAAMLFDAALAEPPGITPRWVLYMDRGKFRLDQGMYEAALTDFREARRIVIQVRADMVPADQDRIVLESGLSAVMEGLVDSGNTIALTTGDEGLPRETFDAAEQDRLWSLRSLVPSSGDWRTRLPDRYWELLSKYQSVQRSDVAGSSDGNGKTAAALRLRIQQIEAAAAGNSAPVAADDASALDHVQKTIDAETVLFSFHVTATSSWVWAVDRKSTGVYRLPSLTVLKQKVARFSQALKTGAPAEELGRSLYRDLFGSITATYLDKRKWLLEPDGPLYELPFAALITGGAPGRPDYLIAHAALQSIPGALLLERGTIRANGNFLGIGDPVYNRADPRYNGHKDKSEFALPRLPNSGRELAACARIWGSDKAQLLTGSDAGLSRVQAAIATSPSIIHFATHVVGAAGQFRSGLIALSLNDDGQMGLLGPTDIVAHPVKGSVIVMDGCHSNQGEALASSGLMGLTRSWIGAGAGGVIATQWDVPDTSAQSLMTSFYTELKRAPELGLAAALRAAQLREIAIGAAGQHPGNWAGYFLMSRM